MQYHSIMISKSKTILVYDSINIKLMLYLCAINPYKKYNYCCCQSEAFDLFHVTKV